MVLSCHTGKVADISDLPLKNLHGAIASHCLPEELPWAVSASPVLTYRGETLFPLSLGNTTFIIIQNTLPCRAEAQDHIIKTSVMNRWCCPAAANSHLLVPTPECSILPFFLPGSFTNPEFIDNYLHNQNWGGSRVREVGRSKQLDISSSWLNLPTITVLACCNNELEGFNITGVISRTST